MENTDFFKLMNSNSSDEFVNDFLNDLEKYSSFTLCNECELFEIKGINLITEAKKIKF